MLAAFLLASAVVPATRFLVLDPAELTLQYYATQVCMALHRDRADRRMAETAVTVTGRQKTDRQTDR
jgi:hypothetical protein